MILTLALAIFLYFNYQEVKNETNGEIKQITNDYIISKEIVKSNPLDRIKYINKSSATSATKK